MMVRNIVYRVVSFFYDHWKKATIIVVAFYFITTGATLLLGASGIPGLPYTSLSALNMAVFP